MEAATIRTHDGDCRAWLFTPRPGRGQAKGQGQRQWPGAIFFMDGLAIRPVLFTMAQRLADAGYAVLLPDMFYRAGPYEPVDVKAVFATGSIRSALGHLFASTDRTRAAQDTGCFLDWLAARPDVAPGKVGVTGYCMGGAAALIAAGTYPDRVAAAASFHGGDLATDAPDSPHRLAPRITARVIVAGADNDASYPPEMQARLDAALTAAGVDHRCEIYPGALHGWTMADFPIYNEEAAERHWRELLALFEATLA
ncbi:MAG: dienelactone hydrolase family protein [Sphingomonadales bacterium]|nr:dienelactone hydrolase family protein [Sphingomonadales bacterium]